MAEPARYRISASMAIDSLSEQVFITNQALEEYRKQISIRNELIRDCRRSQIPVARVCRITGLSKDQIMNISRQSGRLTE